jgi:hypothetical protein
MQDKTTLRLIHLTYSGKELEAMLKAWEKYPTLKKDCRMTRELTEKARKAFAGKILSGKLVV